MSIAVLDAIAEEEGTDPMELTTPLYDAIDPEALDSLFTDGSGEIRFTYYGYRISVTSSGEVSVESL